jgi:hypothetical protein
MRADGSAGTPLVIAVVALVVLAPTAGAHCIKRHEVPIAKGTSPTGWHWSVEGSIGNNGPCGGDWLFGMDFNLEGAVAWGTSTGIPAGGELGGRPEVSASDDLLLDGSDRVFSGMVEGEAVKLVATLSNNKHLVIHPRLPSAKLRRNVTWLRGVRYFVAYYLPEGFVTGIRTFDRAGTLLYRDRTFEAR